MSIKCVMIRKTKNILTSPSHSFVYRMHLIQSIRSIIFITCILCIIFLLFTHRKKSKKKNIKNSSGSSSGDDLFTACPAIPVEQETSAKSGTVTIQAEFYFLNNLSYFWTSLMESNFLTLSICIFLTFNTLTSSRNRAFSHQNNRIARVQLWC